ncbi:carbohydrate ABC transporter permease [Micromonospora sp. NPDC047740]|uniref:carbohydrate ABC transporter permease n=1 Tax=Micromonospora sp. NPDC047740 TaxID=3364254 RepID=UPI0037190BA5
MWAAASLLPVVYMLSASMQSTQEIYAGVRLLPASWHWENYTQAWRQASFGTYLGNSVLYTATATIGVLLVSSCAAYAFSRLRFPGRNLIYSTLLVFLFIPVPGAFIPLYVVLVRLGLVDTRLGYILPLVNSCLPVAVFILRRFFDELPREIEEAAQVDGAGRLSVYWRIALPLARPAIATVAILTILSCWNEFVLALVVFSDAGKMPLQVGLQTFQGTYFANYGLMMAALSITTVPVVLAYLAFQRFIIRGIMAGAVKG